MGLYDPDRHLLSSYKDRIHSPFVSFGNSTLVCELIENYGWGHDPVVIKANVGAGRALVKPGFSEVLLVGGLAPEEFVRTYEPEQFTHDAKFNFDFEKMCGYYIENYIRKTWQD